MWRKTSSPENILWPPPLPPPECLASLFYYNLGWKHTKKHIHSPTHSVPSLHLALSGGQTLSLYHEMVSVPPTQKKLKIRVWGFGVKWVLLGFMWKNVPLCMFRCNKAQEATCAVKGNSVGVIDPDSKPMYVQVWMAPLILDHNVKLSPPAVLAIWTHAVSLEQRKQFRIKSNTLV